MSLIVVKEECPLTALFIFSKCKKLVNNLKKPLVFFIDNIYSDFELIPPYFLAVCAGWLIGHTVTEDLSIIGKCIRKWENLLPSEELAAMKELITQFHTE